MSTGCSIIWFVCSMCMTRFLFLSLPSFRIRTTGGYPQLVLVLVLRNCAVITEAVCALAHGLHIIFVHAYKAPFMLVTACMQPLGVLRSQPVKMQERCICVSHSRCMRYTAEAGTVASAVLAFAHVCSRTLVLRSRTLMATG